eukprot:scaffold22636_cov28-Tisochrysis_lutea.AAC.2
MGEAHSDDVLAERERSVATAAVAPTQGSSSPLPDLHAPYSSSAARCATSASSKSDSAIARVDPTEPRAIGCAPREADSSPRRRSSSLSSFPSPSPAWSRAVNLRMSSSRTASSRERTSSAASFCARLLTSAASASMLGRRRLVPGISSGGLSLIAPAAKRALLRRCRLKKRFLIALSVRPTSTGALMISHHRVPTSATPRRMAWSSSSDHSHFFTSGQR